MTTQVPATPSSEPLPPQRAPARSWPWLLTGLAALVALAYWVDLPLMQLLHRETTPVVDDFFEDVGDLANTDLFAVLALLVYAGALWAMRRGGGRFLGVACERWARGSLLVLAAMVVGGLVTLVLKQVVARARPEVFFDAGYYGLGTPFAGDPFDSFPSSHTLTAFAVAAALAKLVPVLRWPLFLLAAAVGLSRLVNLDHYLSDVLAAALVAVVSVRWLAPRVLDVRQAWALRAPWQWRRKA